MKKEALWRGLTSVLAVLLAFLFVMTNVAWGYENLINSALNVTTRKAVESESSSTVDTAFYKSDYGDVNHLTEEDLDRLNADEDAFIVQEMEEGAVLLKNDNNALPLAQDERRVTLFGSGSAKPLYHGNSGGGDNDPSREVSFYQALKDEGFTINEALYQAYLNSPTTRKIVVTNEQSAGTYGGTDSWSIGEEPISFYTDELKSTFSDYNDVAIVVLTRACGEDSDLPTSDEDGVSYLSLHQDEKDMLNMIYQSGQFDKIILINNSPNPLELGWLDEYHVDACLWIGNPGLVGFRGVVNLLTGAANPSGRLVDTYAASSLSAPSVQNYGSFTFENSTEITDYCADDDKYVTHYMVYAEGIYVGYKYYETRYEDCVLGQGGASSGSGVFASQNGAWSYADEVVYPFGYGLSYTTFQQTLDSVTEADGTFTVSVTVTNTGDTAGKDVVQVYAQTPYTDYDRENLVEKSAIQLLGFGKTGLLEPGQSEPVTVTCDKYLLASYDYTNAKGYILDAGDY
ncbi:glycoside hydrolase family 3 C-terminal domain-containing protein [uncultured Pseudoflavonifractor sp.]|uniref:glycoside hydrolase family 3 C-terminal domain-containing protein n=1 Tax=uncultured Pseudoflavonifractor sp. TaxID=1221379 RepID=UPI0025E26253|nr:glycoside hydrolase family 3 C-terminal domain-containing protein [uncultured Pseudoflavonifractor sp.]